MYKRIIVVVACALFSLLALLAIVITDLHDRDFPQSIDVKNRLSFDFSESHYSITEALAILEELDARWDLGLVKVAPDLASDNDSQVFARLNDGNTPTEFTWFRGDDIGKIVGKERLTTSYPDGFYLVTGDNTHLDEFENKLKDEGVKVGHEDASIFDSLGFIVWERGFFAAVLAAFSLIVALALFWLSLRAHGRSLRVLGGSPTTRIQVQDLGEFGIALLISASVVTIVAGIYVGLFHGWLYVGTFLKALVSLQVAVITVSLLAALVMSAFAWPSATMIATRQPAVKSLRSVAIVVQALTFFLVVSAAGPAWSAYKHSTAIAAEMSQWKQLANQVAIEFATDVDEMNHMEPQIGELVKDAELKDSLALSYTYNEEMQVMVDFGEYSLISFVNQRWIDLVTKDVPHPAVISATDVPESLVQMVQEEMEILSRKGNTKELLEQFQFMQPVNGFKMPVAQGGGGEKLHFSDDVLLVVVPSPYDTYNDSSLTSMGSSSNIMFTDVSFTQKLLKRHDLDVRALRDRDITGELNVVYVAEEGILQAQYAAYIVWLQNLALIALVIAFTVAAAISAIITARLQAKRDFPLRLAGRSWLRIVRARVVKGLLVGAGLVGVVLMFQNYDTAGAILVVAAYGLLVVPVSHILATRWCFNGVSKRQI